MADNSQLPVCNHKLKLLQRCIQAATLSHTKAQVTTPKLSRATPKPMIAAKRIRTTSKARIIPESPLSLLLFRSPSMPRSLGITSFNRTKAYLMRKRVCWVFISHYELNKLFRLKFGPSSCACGGFTDHSRNNYPS